MVDSLIFSDVENGSGTCIINEIKKRISVDLLVWT